MRDDAGPKRARKNKPGDDSPLKPQRPWQVLSRSIFRIETGPAGEVHEYAVDVDHFDLDEKVALYRDGRQHLVAGTPATFVVPGGAIEVARSTFGVSRMHLVADSGEERVLAPDRHSAEYWRLVLDRRHPRLSRWIGRVAIGILVVGLVLFVPQLLELVSGIDVVAENVGTFTSPISLPAWLNVTLLVAGILASTERALTLRNHWLLDLDTWWLG
ncbi:hypothetical protein [Occultella kanbiaonis]|uniref:hypothetical protein n=1 Tax=Occultella kanbiaonis TaxID=2675754 RepID=UPI0012B943B8|nr:hypothetical protein [Occultella kanbiaonis]